MQASRVRKNVVLLGVLILSFTGIFSGEGMEGLTSGTPQTPGEEIVKWFKDLWNLRRVSAATCGTTSQSIYPLPSASKPDYLTGEIFSPFACMMKRIVNDPTDALRDRTWGTYARHQYSRVQPWNPDQSLLLVKAGSPTSRFYLLDGTTYTVRSVQCSNKWYGGISSRWHPSKAHPRERIYVLDNTLGWYHVDTCTSTRVWTLPFTPLGIGDSEGNPSNDGRYLMLGDNSGTKVSSGKPFSKQAFVMDMQSYPSLRRGPIRNIHQDCVNAGSDDCETDWLSVSASGTFAVVQFARSARVYDINVKTLALTPRPLATALPSGCEGGTAAQGYMLKMVHPDMGLDRDGNSIIVGSTRCKLQGKVFGGKPFSWVTKVRLWDGAMTPLTDPTNEAQAWHISLRNHDRPGWAYVSYYAQDGMRYSGEIIAVKLDGSKQVERFAHHHTHVDDAYEAEPHAVPSRDGQRVLFTSNWSDNCTSGCGDFGIFQDFVVGRQ